MFNFFKIIAKKNQLCVASPNQSKCAKNEDETVANFDDKKKKKEKKEGKKD
jgi:hypothetical protein